MRSVLETERLALRRFTMADVDLLCELDSDPAVMRYLNGGTATPRAVIVSDVLPAFLHSYAPIDGFGVWAALAKDNGDFIGWFSLRPLNGADAQDVTLGYRLRQAAWGRGYATEGARALLRQGFTKLGVQRVFATTYEYNDASRRVMEKIGMTLVRSFRFTSAELVAESETHVASQTVWDGDEVEYSLGRADWERLVGSSAE
ncbi:MAG: GNAT family N-acetyltransferase [Ktedonobacterales bacterium]|nr:GNAT family N-acetyltransferase [Ktedonobacterales bacterium]